MSRAAARASRHASWPGDVMALTMLNRKLVRDVWAMRSQALAVALVVAAGVAIYVMYQANFASLRDTQAGYYARQRFADVFVSLTRAPASVTGALTELPGVSAVETRVVAPAILTTDSASGTANARVVSIPAARRPRVNDLLLRSGAWIEPGRDDQVIVSEGFARARKLAPGDRLSALINGRRYRLSVVGTALSPEYVYTIPPGELVPDDSRFGIVWMEERALAAAMNMNGAFNDVVVRLGPGVAPEATMARLDRLLAPYGGLGASPRTLQLSHWFVSNELKQLQSFGWLLPSIFLFVGAFILNVALTRALALQRTQIAALKALGYGTAAIAWHYIKWALVIGMAGLLIGLAAGQWLGAALGRLYNEVFRFPDLQFRIGAEVWFGATLLTCAAATFGAWLAVWRAVRIPPAEAMRPEPPLRYHRTAVEMRLAPRLDASARMILRHLVRRPLRAGMSIVGIAIAVAVLMFGLLFTDVIDQLIVMQFFTIERQHATVTFAQPRSARAVRGLARLPGVLAVEPQRVVPVRLRAGYRHRTVAVIGISPAARLKRIVEADGRVLRPPTSGLALSRALATALGAGVGQPVTVEVLEGARPVRDVPVTTLVDDVFGVTAYMDLDALHALMHEGDVSTGALLLIDPARQHTLAAALEARPLVAGTSFSHDVARQFRDTMSANLSVTTLINVLFAAVIAVGVVYNSARVSLSEHSRELASLRVLGFTRAEISMVLLGELVVLTVLALPIGWLLGYALAQLMVRTAESEVYRIPLTVAPSVVGWASLGVVGAAIASGLLVRRRLDRLDLVAVLKTQE
jgi:putative ABC transport system permease protein